MRARDRYFLACITLLISLFSAVNTAALEPVPTPVVRPGSPIMITAYQIRGTSLDFIQLYNWSSELVALDGMTIEYQLKKSSGEVSELRDAAMLQGLIEPKRHIILTTVSNPLSSHSAFTFEDTADSAYQSVVSIQVGSLNFASSTGPSTLKTDGSVHQRGKTSTGYSTVTFGAFDGTLYADDLYSSPAEPALKIVEVSARAKECPPFDESAMCGDFIKLKRAPGAGSDLAQYRIRTGDPASSASITNSFSLANGSLHGDYLLLRLRDDGQMMSLVNSGGYLWIEDSYGTVQYQNSLINYADAGSEKYIDQSWAYDESDLTWKWAYPSPTADATFVELAAAKVEKIGEVLGVCAEGKYRSPETNRCRSLEDAVNEISMCEEGKERNPLTNRCRSIATLATATLSPCSEGEERNPATNRCRKVAAAESSLKPCEEGQERNAETNRCRRVLSSVASSATQPLSSDQQPKSLFWLGGAVLLGAAGYGVYEWRSEISKLFRRFIPSAK